MMFHAWLPARWAYASLVTFSKILWYNAYCFCSFLFKISFICFSCLVLMLPYMYIVPMYLLKIKTWNLKHYDVIRTYRRDVTKHRGCSRYDFQKGCLLWLYVHTHIHVIDASLWNSSSYSPVKVNHVSWHADTGSYSITSISFWMITSQVLIVGTTVQFN